MLFKRKRKGYQIIIDLYKISGQVFTHKDYIKKKILEFIQIYKLHSLKHVEYRFPNDGVTRVYILSESHLILHTWPEYNYINIDLFSCSGKIKIDKSYIKKMFNCKKMKTKKIYHPLNK